MASVAGGHLPEEADWAFSSFWMYTVLIDETVSPLDSRKLIQELADQKIQTRPLWQPIHRSRAHSNAASPPSPNADTLYRQAISLPCSVGLTTCAQDRVVEVIAGLMKRENEPLTKY
jgi:dTDP-4-amino-4,6-dideoxygalactose transaminase